MEAATTTAGACWQCDAPLASDLACDACGIPQPLPPGLDHFTVLGLTPSLVVDTDALERRYHEAARQVHPDRHQTAAPRALELSVAASAALNRAFRTLRDPVARGRYWLEMHGSPLGEDNNRVPPALAMFVFETQEQLEEVRQHATPAARAAAESARRDVTERLAAHRTELGERYGDWDARADAAVLTDLKERLSEIAYLTTLLSDVEEALEG